LRPFIVLLIACSGSVAAADAVTTYGESVYKEGPGIRLGGTPLTLHPGIAVEGGYDSNVFYLPSNEVGSGLLRIRGHIDLATLPPQAFEGDASSVDPKIDFRFSSVLEYREYLTSDPVVQQQRSLNLMAAGDFVILPRGPFTLHISDLFVRTVDPRNEESTGNFTRDYNRAGLLGEYRLGSLTVGLGDTFSVNFWETDAIKYGDSYNDEGQAYARLRILSQTVLSLVVRAGWVHYYNNNAVDSRPFRALLGATTLFTSWFGASAAIGYGNSFSTGGPSANGVLAQLEARFILPHRARISLAYDRDFADSIFADYYFDDHVGVVYVQPLVRRLSANLAAGIRFRHYDGLIDPKLVGGVSYNSTTRDDILYDVRAELSVQAQSWLAIAASYNLLDDSTPFAIVQMNGNQTPVHYLKQSAFLRVDIAY
jgi:hypothetical protein